MSRKSEEITVVLSQDEAHEILMRCLQSAEADTVLFHNAIQKLARAIERSKEQAA